MKMLGLDVLVNKVLVALDAEEKRDKPMSPSCFKFTRKAKELIEPCRNNVKHHREREKHYTSTLETAEAMLRSKGISIEILDPRTGIAMGSEHSITSGGVMAYGATTPGQMPKFQPKIDQELMGKVEKAKTSMLEHRGKAEQFEKY